MKKLNYRTLIANPENGNVSRKSVTLWIMVICFVYIVIKGSQTGVYPPDGVLFTIGGLIFGVLGLSVHQKGMLPTKQ